MVNFYIYAKDFSGSTQDIPYFHENGLKTFKQFQSDVRDLQEKLAAAGEPKTESKIMYLHWGDECYEVNEKKTIDAYHNMEGNMGTEPASIIEWLKLNHDMADKNNKIKLLYIVTDGLIDSQSANYCFQLNEDMNYEKIVFHAFNEDLSSIDLSVASSFFKNQCKVYRNYMLYDNVDISEEFDYDKINLDNFADEKENMKSYIKLKFIKEYKHDITAHNEIEQLKKLRNRLFAELASKTEKGEPKLNTKDKNTLINEFKRTIWYTTLKSQNQDFKADIEGSISTMINYIVSEKKSYSFDAIKFDTKYNTLIEEEPVNVDVNFETEQEIEFPDIIMDDEKGIPVIILMELNLLDKIIFHNTKDSAEVSPASFSKFKSTMDCPLFLLNDPDISQSIGYFYTLNVYKQLLESDTKTEPRARRPFHGALVLTDTEQFDKYNDYVLSATYFNFKKIKYNIGLFYYVLWKNCENKEWMDRNVVERFKSYVMRRIETTKCKIGLSSLPLDPSEITTLPTALWYCVELSSHLFKDDAKHYAQERLRMYHGVAHCMVEILKYFNYDLDTEFIDRRTDMIKHVTVLKRIPTRREKVYFLLEKIFKKFNGFLVSDIENPQNLNKLNYLKINHKDMFREEMLDEKVHLNDYVHVMYYEVSQCNDERVKLCTKTFRPYFTIDENNSFYAELAKNIKEVVINDDDSKDKIKITYGDIESLSFDKILSLYNLFIKSVQESEKYLTLSEYVDYILRKKMYHGDLVTIFSPNEYTNAETVFNHYQSIVTKVDVKELIDVTKRYLKRTERIKAEEVLKCRDEKEINKFIFNQELRVKLKKNK